MGVGYIKYHSVYIALKKLIRNYQFEDTYLSLNFNPYMLHHPPYLLKNRKGTKDIYDVLIKKIVKHTDIVK